MGNLNFTYSSTGKVLEAPPFFYLGALEKKGTAEKKCLNSSTYGFNGMERDDEWNGTGNAYDFGARIYDSRIGRFLSLDPLMDENHSWSNYNFGLDNPILFIDDNGEWPGITIFFFEFDIGAGLGYGVNAIVQTGVAYDEVGKTQFKTATWVDITNQNLYEGSRDPKVVTGAGFSYMGGVTQNWSSDYFTDMLDQSAGVALPIPIGGRVGAIVSFGGGISEDAITLQAGFGLGIKLTVIGTELREAISLSDAEADEIAFGENWKLSGKVEIYDDKGNIIGYKATMTARSADDSNTNVTIEVYSEIVYDDKGNAQSNGVWQSQDYMDELAKDKSENEE